MNAPLIWIVAPVLVGVFLWFFQNNPRMTLRISVSVCGLLAVLAWLLPISAPIRMGVRVYEVLPTLTVLGRRLVLENSDRSLLVLMYGMGVFWLFGARTAGANRLFPAVGLVLMGLITAAIAVEPFLYAALLIEIAVLLSIPMLTRTDRTNQRGILRYLIFQTLALPFILLAGWAASGVEANPTDQRLLLQALVLLGLGFSLWMAIFPFYTWMPLLSEEAPPYETGFILSLLTLGTSLLLLTFLDSYSWLRSYASLGTILSLTGALMVSTAGIWAAFQQNLRRLLGYAVIFEGGFSLLALSLQSQPGYEIFIAGLAPRIITLAIMALALGVLRFYHTPVTLTLDGVRGDFHRYPFISSALTLVLFSLAGLPLLGSFPLRIVLLEALAQQSLSIVIWVLVGMFGFFLSGIRLLAVLLDGGQTNDWQIKERWQQIVLLGVGILVLFAIGIFPQLTLSPLLNILKAFKHLLQIAPLV